jgi:hypothetical protein
MDIPQALQEMQRLRGLLESRQISPQMYTQAIHQLQIQDAYGSFWHIDGTTLRWHRYDGQNWIEQAPPFSPPPPTAGAPWAPVQPPSRAGSRSYLPLWIGLGVLLLVAIVVVGGIVLSGILAPAPTATPVVKSATLFPIVVTDSPTPFNTPRIPATLSPTISRTYTPTSSLPSLTPSITPRLVSPTPTLPSASDFLQSNGPWLISKDENNLYWVQPQKTDPINAEKVVGPNSLTDMIAPRGGHIAFITSPDPEGMRGLKLVIYDVIGKKTEKTIPLTSTKTEPGPNATPGDNAVSAVLSITIAPGLAWSPDGRQVAFIGVIDGPSSDLYLYSLDTQKVTRLTDGPSHGFGPSWSPDGKYILQFGAASFGTGAGFTMAGVWATRADNGTSIELYKPKSSGEIGLGWADANTYLVYSFSPVCGHYNLRAVGIQPLKVTTLFAGCFTDAAFNPTPGTTLLGISQGLADMCNCAPTKTNAGFYLLQLNGTLKQLNSGDVSNVTWLKNGGAAWGMLEGKGPLLFNQAGQVMTLPSGLPASQPIVSADGKLWAWTGSAISKQPGVWIGSPEGGAPKVSDLPVSSAAWDKFNTTLLFVSGSKLYAAAPPTYKPVLLVNTNSAQQIGWVTP